MRLMNIRSYRDFIVAAQFHFPDLRDFRFHLPEDTTQDESIPEPGRDARVLIHYDFINRDVRDVTTLYGANLLPIIMVMLGKFLAGRNVPVEFMVRVTSHLKLVSEEDYLPLTDDEVTVSAYTYDLYGLWRDIITLLDDGCFNEGDIALPKILIPEANDVQKETGAQGSNGRIHSGFLPEAIEDYIDDMSKADAESVHIPSSIWLSIDTGETLVGTGTQEDGSRITDMDILYFWFNQVSVCYILKKYGLPAIQAMIDSDYYTLPAIMVHPQDKL